MGSLFLPERLYCLNVVHVIGFKQDSTTKWLVIACPIDFYFKSDPSTTSCSFMAVCRPNGELAYFQHWICWRFIVLMYLHFRKRRLALFYHKIGEGACCGERKVAIYWRVEPIILCVLFVWHSYLPLIVLLLMWLLLPIPSRVHEGMLLWRFVESSAAHL